MRSIIVTLLLLTAISGFSQDTTVVQTLTFDSTGRSYMFNFPPDTGQSYEKILMLYTMRCKDGLISPPISGQTNIGCGEWDYSCNTFITDSSKTDSSKAIAPSHIITGFTGTTYNYTTQPTFTYYSFNQQNVVHNSTTSETTASIGTGTTPLNNPFGASSKVSKSQYLWSAAELTTAGVMTGEITSIKFNVSTAAAQTKYLKIKMKHTLQTVLNASTPELTGFTEVYFLNTTLVNGINEFLFHNNFTWDGTSNILLEISYTNSTTGTDNIILGHDAGANLGLVSAGNDYSLDFSGASNVSLAGSSFASISNEITISLWCNGDSAIMPANSTIFEGSDNLNRRQVNAHLPWSDSRVYWDCGNDGSYDRIDNLATNSDFKGQWNHWAFTKNATSGDMKTYLNGALWNSGTGKTKLIDLKNLNLGSAITWNNPYYGKIDDFTVWNAELSQSEIADWMHKDVNPTHPKYVNLLANYNLNEGSGNSTTDQSVLAGTGIINGVAGWKITRGKDLFKGFVETTTRPNITFVQGVYNETITTVNVIDSVQNNPNLVYSYQVVGTNLTPIDTNAYYQAGYSYIYDDLTGAVIDSVLFATENTINITTLNYYNKYPSRFELMSFVTPYGINLDLGMGGKTWQFDVTDFKPILKNAKRLSMDNGGQYQEEMDIRFLFISGTPPRNVIDVQQIWKAGDGWFYTSILNDDIGEPRFITLNPAASMYKLKSAITGHGQQGEFTPRTHYLNVNGGPREMEWSVWKECADNPVYPQGGTWIYDRAGWCPGAATDMKEYDFSNMVTPGEIVEIDYGVTAGSGASTYLVNNQLVSYGPPNFTLDAGIVEIKRPSTRIEYDRKNPICYNPIITIRNSGSDSLTSLQITYSVSGGTSQVYNWTGSLGFMQTADVTLPIPNGSFWIGNGSNKFNATIALPNGGIDQYAQNNTYSSAFNLPDYYAENFIIILKTNNYGYQNSYTIKDINGNVVFTKSGLANNVIYNDTLDFLTVGCYTLEVFDTGDNGLYFWAQTAQGTGYLKIKANSGTILKTFEPEFGKSIYYSFVIGVIDHIKEQNNESYFEVYPNPTTSQITIDIALQEKTNTQIVIVDMLGRIIENKMLNDFNIGTFKFDLSNESNGVYNVSIINKDGIQSKRIVLNK